MEIPARGRPQLDRPRGRLLRVNSRLHHRRNGRRQGEGRDIIESASPPRIEWSSRAALVPLFPRLSALLIDTPKYPSTFIALINHQTSVAYYILIQHHDVDPAKCHDIEPTKCSTQDAIMTSPRPPKAHPGGRRSGVPWARPSSEPHLYSEPFGAPVM